jgi:hypothetical protein
VRHYWKPYDLVELFNSTRSGRIPFGYCSNLDVEGHWADDKFHFALDPTWPYGTPDEYGDREVPMLVIENNIPVPSRTGIEIQKKSAEIRDALLAMKPGQSFALESDSKQECQSLIMAVHRVRKEKCPDRMIICRKYLPENGSQKWKLRVWLVSNEPTP